MIQLAWTALIPICCIIAWLIVRRPVRHAVEELRGERAREIFRMQREGLEARFLRALAGVDIQERERWEEAHWHDDIVWARDRRSRHLLALVGVHFDADPFSEFPDAAPRHATALFEFSKGQWRAEGKRLDEVRPDEAFLRNQRFEPVVLPHRRD